MKRQEVITFIPTNDIEVLPPYIGEIVWVCKYNDSDTDFIKIPLRCIKTYDDRSWDGEEILEEGEA